MFSMNDSIRDILDTSGLAPYLKFFYSDDALALFPKEYLDEPLRMIRYRGSEGTWQLMETTEHLLDAANMIRQIQQEKRKCWQIWKHEEWQPTESSVYNDPANSFFITPRLDKMKGDKKPAVIICPGGGYTHVAMQHEGTPFAYYLEKRGYQPFILRYRVHPALYPEPQMDLLAVISYIRLHAIEYDVDPDRIAVIGFSAAGHLCASAAALYDEIMPLVRAEALRTGLVTPEEADSLDGHFKSLILGYPVVTFEKGVTHESSFEHLTGWREDLRKGLSVENLIAPGFPSTFIWHNEDDGAVPVENSKRLDAVLTDKNIPHELHLYPTGGHGVSMAYGLSAWEWVGKMMDYLKNNL